MRRLFSVLVPLSCVLAAACSSASPAASRPNTPQVHQQPADGTAAPRVSGTFTPWWTYHRTPSRSGHTTHGVGTPLKPAWTKQLGDAVYGEPLVVGSTLIVATEGNRVFGLSARTGHVGWQAAAYADLLLGCLSLGDLQLVDIYYGLAGALVESARAVEIAAPFPE